MVTTLCFLVYVEGWRKNMIWKKFSHFTHFPAALCYHGRLGFWSVPTLSSLLSVSHSLACNPALVWWKHCGFSVWLHNFLAFKTMFVVEVKTHPAWHPQEFWGSMVYENQEVGAQYGTESRGGSQLGCLPSLSLGVGPWSKAAGHFCVMYSV
jgi:hypothetical protein